MKYKLIFTDFDGTFLKDDLTIGERSKAAVRDYVARGGNFVICTGRPTHSVFSYLPELGLSRQKISAVGFQGGHIVGSRGELIDAKLLDNRAARKIIAKFYELGYYVHTYDFDYVYVEEYNDINRDYVYFTGVKLKRVGNLVDYMDANPDFNPVKVLAVIPEEKMDEVVEIFAKEKLDGVRFHPSSATYLEFVPQCGGKGNSLVEVAELLGIDIADTIAVGDNMNDLSMIRAAGLGVAVANARAELKAEADYIAPGNNDDAICDVIEKFCAD